MSKKIKHILLSCNEDPIYIHFWPTVAEHYKVLGYKVHLGFLSDKDENSELVKKLKMFGDSVTLYKPNSNFNVVIQSKLLRWYMSSRFKDDIVCIKDIDQYVLNEAACEENMVTNNIIYNDKICNIGFNCYKDCRDYKKNGIYKFPASPSIGKGKNLYKMFINKDVSFHEFLYNIKTKTDTINGKSDEVVILDLNSKNVAWAKNHIINYMRKDVVSQYTNARIDRGSCFRPPMTFDKKLLENGYYECLCPTRPYDMTKMKYLLDYMKISEETQKFKLY